MNTIAVRIKLRNDALNRLQTFPEWRCDWVTTWLS